MIEPTMAALLAKVSSRFRLVQAAALRTRELNDGAKPRLECQSENPLTIALHEIAAGKVTVRD
ncbi:MAG: DNA-directed RNA polymerase subunit omega [Armatimonadota bacterium]